jgi:serpin B
VRQVALQAAGGGQPRNFIVSPLSFHAVFALVAAGTRGETQRELLRFLGSGSLDELHRGAAVALVRRLRDVAETASFACGVWVDRNRHLTPEFADAAALRYAAVAESVDFFSEHEQARQRVNAFVREATKGLIADVLPPDSVNSFTVLVLANALYFKGTWARPFNPSRTFTAPFHLPGGDTVPAPFMTANLFNEQLIAVFPGFKALKLPYTTRGAHQAAFHMLLLLPDGEALKISDLYDMAVSTPGVYQEAHAGGRGHGGAVHGPKVQVHVQVRGVGEHEEAGSHQSLRRRRLLRHGYRRRWALYQRSVPQGHH